MFGGGDPFGNPFEHMRRTMEQMEELQNNMFNNMMGGDPFGMFGNPRLQQQQMIGNVGGQLRQRPRAANDMMSPFGGFGFGGGLFGGMMQQMEQMQNHAMNDPRSAVFSESTMISYDGTGQPKVVQNSTRKVGDVKETRRSVKNGEEQHLSVGHHVGERAHVIEKKRDKDGKIRQQQRFVNLDEDEAEQFNNEGSRRAVSNGSNASAPIVTIPDESDDEDTHGRNRRSGRKDVENFVYSNTRGGPSIHEIVDDDDDDETGSNKRRRKGLFGKILRD
ncbi:myelodysplasia-myeloid leukemia factor 1-interacting protein domain-containing protein [Ditylenchus destructor]|uniref:Myelodysplasia-myeloid leukemia factor 1-interacting protein domain-containing protein n=1 Tax=Ditylenchus destructor TaxID=166010 RepID=A0AAD4RDF6_9BILA|nr:myelodysplasia-myeloid leukemia factor 1-interacting protein domain-containing protein [Ditylenchus destructor]